MTEFDNIKLIKFDEDLIIGYIVMVNFMEFKTIQGL